MDEIAELIAATRHRFAPDPRIAIFDVEYDVVGGDLVLTGSSTEPAAIAALLSEARGLTPTGIVVDRIRPLPDPSLGERRHAVVRAAIAPVLAAPRVSATQTSQNVLGARLALFEREGQWLRVRGPDGYLGWVHHGYLDVRDGAGAAAWSNAAGGEAVISLGALLVDPAGRPMARLPWGALAVQDDAGLIHLPDRGSGALGAGEVVPLATLPQRFPPDRLAVVMTARLWSGTPYLWGGVTESGADCSGFVQAVFGMHGVRLPRDSDMQASCGEDVAPGKDFADLVPGDLLFFAESGDRISHVAISAGGGKIVHAAIANGGVAEDDLVADYDVARRLRAIFVRARRVLGNRSDQSAIAGTAA